MSNTDNSCTPFISPLTLTNFLLGIIILLLIVIIVILLCCD